MTFISIASDARQIARLPWAVRSANPKWFKAYQQLSAGGDSLLQNSSSSDWQDPKRPRLDFSVS